MADNNYKNIYVTGDTHGAFGSLINLTRILGITKDDLLIILGDVGANITNDEGDIYRKMQLAKIPATILCIQGNHEMRPTHPGIVWEYQKCKWHGGNIWVEQDFPKILFAEDGDRYEINDHSFFVIGGAYSVDKEYRLTVGAPWFSDEQPDDEIKKRVMDQLKKDDYKEDNNSDPYMPDEHAACRQIHVRHRAGKGRYFDRRICGREKIFDNVSFSLDSSWKTGLIGRNGRGKPPSLICCLGNMNTVVRSSVTLHFRIFHMRFQIRKHWHLRFCRV